MDKNEIVIFETEDKMITIPVAVGNETVWLNRNQMAELFDRDVKTIGKHINNALKEELEEDKMITIPVAVGNETVWLNRNQMAELFDRDVKTIGKHINNALKEELESDKTTVAKFATVQKEGQREVERQIEFYNLDVIISVGYHVKSKRGFICGWGKENRRRCFSGADNYDCGIQTGGKGNDDQCISVGYHVKSKRGFICGWGKENRRRCFSGADNYDCGIQTGGKGNDDQCDYELHAIRGKSENIAPNDTYLFTTGSK